MLLLMEGFENMEPNGRPDLYRTSGVAGFVAGRTGGKAVSNTSGAAFLAYTTPGGFTNSTKLVLSFAAFTTVTAHRFNLNFLNESSANTWRLSAGASAIEVRYGGSSTIRGTFARIPINEWVRVEITVDVAVGIEIRYNGNIVYSEALVSGVAFSGFNIDSGYSYNNVLLDDLYMVDSVGAAPYNASLGDARVETLVPQAIGLAQEWTPSAGTSDDNWFLVREMPASSADFVTAAAPELRDIHAFTNLSDGGAVLAVQLNAAAFKSDAGAASLKFVQDDGTTETASAGIGLSTTAGFVAGPMWTTDASGNPWSAAILNSSQFGIRSGS